MRPFLIFLVDDDPFFMKMMEEQLIQHKYLFNHDYHVKTFHSGESALESMQLNPDIVILDYQLDTKFHDADNGLQILKKIKSKNNRTRVILLSLQDKLQIAINLHEAGAYDYIIKSESSFLRIKNAIRDIFDSIDDEERLKKQKLRLKITRAVHLISYAILIGTILYLVSMTK
jgi:two-component system OmpR family response regulator